MIALRMPPSEHVWPTGARAGRHIVPGFARFSCYRGDMAGIDEGLLDEKLAVVERAREWSPRLVSKLEALLHSADDGALHRINPMRFASERHVPPAEAIDLFLH